jgi:hypothetical protein
MHLLILCHPSQLGRHSLLCLQVIPVLLHRLPHCHVRPPAPLPYCHVRPLALLPHNHVWPPAPLPHCHVRPLAPLRRRLFALYMHLSSRPASRHCRCMLRIFDMSSLIDSLLLRFRHLLFRHGCPLLPARRRRPLPARGPHPLSAWGRRLSTLRLLVQVLLPLDCPRVLSPCPLSLISTA